jgi:HEPN domain-containing protein
MLYLVIIKNNMNKETAVEWFVKELFKKIDYIQVDPKLIEQAIAMEKEQIMNAYLEGESDADHYEDSASRFYNETYGGDK